ncbi:MAG: tRNA dihydrouridine synthase DusB [Bdellovibrionota bacterium]
MRAGRFELENPLALAPMCGVTDLPMRRLARRHGAALCFTQMISADGLLQGSEKTEELLATDPGDRVLGVQIFGGRPEFLAEAARRICGEWGAEWIDLNMGCPVKKVACHEAGSGLLKDLPLVARIWEAMRKALSGQNFSVKVRSGWDANSLVVDEIARMADGCGLDAITLHPRTRAQGYSGEADWSLIGKLKALLPRTAVFGSGDLLSPEAGPAMMARTGADGCYFARGATGNPWIFSRALALLEGRPDPGPPAPEERYSTIVGHLREMSAFYGEERAVKMFRTHLSGYLKGLPRAAEMRHRIFSLCSEREVAQALAAFLLPKSPDAFAAKEFGPAAFPAA